ncbi:MAG: hypothetical protein LKG27_03110 [Clostridiaceae bacterium]|jgi:hypothetical protein|nr:hypothetical protein [Clostridiaceae bacterium]
MKIPEVSYNFMHRVTSVFKSKPKVTTQGLPDILYQVSNDTFCKSPIKTIEDFYKAQKFEVEDYKNMTPELKNRIAKSVPAGVKYRVNETIGPSIAIKSFLDKKYGENNYIFLSLGTSPSTVAKALEFMGVETKYMPGSKLSELYCHHPHFYYKIKAYAKYMNDLGIERKLLKSRQKKLVCYDFTFSGESLRMFKYMAWHEGKLSIFNTRFRSLNDDLYKIAREKGHANMFDYFVKNHMGCSNVQHFSTIPHINFMEFDNIEKIMKNHNYTRDVKFFNFDLFKALEDKMAKCNQSQTLR